MDKLDAVKIIANELLEKEVLYKDDLTRLIGPRPFEGDDTNVTNITPEPIPVA
jgi:cell division protease FtsH